MSSTPDDLAEAEGSPGDEGDPSGALDRALERRRRDAAVRSLYGAARGALRLVRIYARDPRSSGRRERECLDEVLHLRRTIATLRSPALPARIGATFGGVRKAGDATPPASSAQRAG